MHRWLAIAAGSSLIAAGGAQAQMKGLSPDDIVSVSKTRVLDLRLAQELGIERPSPVMRGMIVHREIAPNATLGLGLSNVYSKRSARNDWRIGDRAGRSRKPAITFVLKF